MIKIIPGPFAKAIPSSVRYLGLEVLKTSGEIMQKIGGTYENRQEM
jgi:hypothetical protein